MGPIREFVALAGAARMGIESLDKDSMRRCVRVCVRACVTLLCSVLCTVCLGGACRAVECNAMPRTLPNKTNQAK